MTCAFNPTLIGYFTARPFAAANLFCKGRRRFAAATTLVLTAGAIAQTIYSGPRWINAGRPPFSKLFESPVMFALTLVVMYLAFQSPHKTPAPGMNYLLSGLHSYSKAFARFDKRLGFVRKQVSMSKMGNRFWSNQQNRESTGAANANQTTLIGFPETFSTRND